MPTDDTVAVKDALVAPAAIVRLAGTDTALELLARETLWPVESAAMVSETVHVVLPAPVKLLFAHVKALIEGAIDELDPLKLIDVDFVLVPWLAVKVTVVVVLTANAVAANVALVAPEATVTEPGTTMEALLLARLTARPVLGAAADKVTVHVSVPAPIMDELAHFRLCSDAVVPLPCSLIVLDDFVVVPEVVIVVTLRVPVESVAAFALYWTFSERL